MSDFDFERHRAAFLESLRVHNRSVFTIESRMRALLTFGRFAEERGIERMCDVTPEIVHAYHLDLEERGLKAASRSNYLQALRRFFEHLEKTDVVLINPCAGQPLPKTTRGLPRSLTRDHARQLINAPDTSTPKGLRDRAILELFYSTGIRLAEMVALTLHDVDCRNGLVHVVRGKGGKGRMVPMGEKAVESVQRYLLEVRSAWLRNHAACPCLWLSAIEPHGPIRKITVQVMVRDYGRLVGIDVTPHLWRHTCATHLVNNGANIAYVQRLLGHASLETTQIYTRVTMAEVKAAYHKAHPRSRKS